MQRNYCVSFLQKSQRDYYNNLNEKNICDEILESSEAINI